MTRLEKSIKLFFDQKGIDLKNTSFLVACSGGLDSMTLSHVMLSLGANISIAHCNFKLRGEESDMDEEFVEAFASNHGLMAFIRQFNTQSFAEEMAMSIQMAARELRYEFFEEILKRQAFDFLLTAHHMDDSLETILINLSRGTGISGLRGVPSSRSQILRPMHQLNRSEIEGYAKSKEYQWREDSSNNSDHYQRNYIRHHVSPHLKMAGNNFETGFKQSLDYIGKDLYLYHFLLHKITEEISHKKGNELWIDLQKIQTYPSIGSILSYVLKPYGPFDISAIDKSMAGQSGIEFHSPSHTLLRDRDFFILSPIGKLNNQEYSIEKDAKEIQNPLALKFQMVIEEIQSINKDPSTATLDFDKLQFPLIIRRWKEGDSFVPLGMKNSKKLSDFFIDEKLSRLDKSKVWLLCSGNKIVWIIGHRINDQFKVTKTTKTAYFVRPLNQFL